ncbi:MAG TPA: hypothetical protein VLI05_03720 [Candidatus Saccharimonadia bacterium]|nr:hypothetical protein [Candidatus Saccharimonadia bacterium]
MGKETDIAVVAVAGLLSLGVAAVIAAGKSAFGTPKQDEDPLHDDPNGPIPGGHAPGA